MRVLKVKERKGGMGEGKGGEMKWAREKERRRGRMRDKREEH